MEGMSFSNLKSGEWFKEYSNWLPLLQWATWGLVVFLFARVFWIWVLYFTTPSEIAPVNIGSGAMVKKSNKIDTSKLRGMNLFGAINKEPVKKVEQQNVVDTKLNLKLRGIFAADTPAKANAIIEDGRGKQAVYFIDEKLKVSGRVFLREVYVDKIILETNGTKEALRLVKEKSPIVIRKSPDKPPGARTDKRTEDKRNDKLLTRKLNDYRNKLRSDPRSVADVISGRPHFINGELQGFRIQPGRDKRLFNELGLRRGDIVKSINGIELTNMQEAMTLMRDAQSLQELNVQIQRGNDSLSLLLNLNEK